MGHHLDGSDGQDLHHLLTQSPWDHTQLFAQIKDESKKLFRKNGLGSYLLIDEVGFRKKGNSSACVAKQYLGCVGKYDNGQVAVAAGLSVDDYYCPLEMRLFMPESWENDSARREKCAIPDSVKHVSKTEIAREMILSLYHELPGAKYCVFDSLYGANVDLLAALIENKIPFVGGTKKSYKVYFREPKWILPKKKSGTTGPKFSTPIADSKAIQIQSYLKNLNGKAYKSIKIRMGTKGFIRAKFHLRDVWVMHKQTKNFLSLQLLVRKDPDGKLYYSLCHSLHKASIKELAQAQGQRVFIERIFEEGKNIVGMADYQTRSWTGFHRHMALCCLSLLFLMKQKMKLRPKVGTITAYQIQELIILTIKYVSTPKLIIRNLGQRIQKYQTQIEMVT